MKKIKILYLITGLTPGGAELTLKNLILKLNPELLKRIILASTKKGDLVLDPFCGSSTTGVAALLLNRKYVGIDSEKEYLQLSKKRLEEAY